MNIKMIKTKKQREVKPFKFAAIYFNHGDEVRYNEFGIFKIRSTRKAINAIDVTFNGKYPYVSRGEKNNGIRGYINYDEQYLNPGNTISFGQDTATIFFQEKAYFTGNRILVLDLNPKYGSLNKRIALYLITIAKKAFANYRWGQQSFAPKDIAKVDLYLPVIPGTSDLDFKYMEDRVKELEQDRVKELDNYLTVSGLNDYELTDEERITLKYQPKYKEFLFSNVFDIKKGKRLTKAQQTEGKTLFIGSTSINHGETARIGQEPIFKGNAITVCYNGSVGETFYQEEDFWASDDINVIRLKNKELTPLIANYLSALIRKASKKYGYTYKWNLARMKTSTLSLPVDSNNHIDFDYMERYIKVIQKLTIKGVVEYKDKVIEKTKEII